MASGIYKLTFSSGKYYIGKSLDLETRWKQHFNKFATGKAARPMQLEYDRCGLPQTEVIFHCHKDHIDILEEWLIDQEKGPDMLNTTYPQVERTAEIAELINNSHGMLEKSTWEHLKFIKTYEQIAQEAVDEMNAACARTDEYRNKGYIIDQDYTDMVDLAQKQQDQLEQLEFETMQQQKELDRLSKLGFLERLFGYRVYV